MAEPDEHEGTILMTDDEADTIRHAAVNKAVEEDEEVSEGDDNAGAVPVPDADLKTAIEEILGAGDLETLTSKKVREALEKKFQTKLEDTAKKKFINGCIQEHMDPQDDGEEEEPPKKLQLSTELSEFLTAPFLCRHCSG